MPDIHTADGSFLAQAMSGIGVITLKVYVSNQPMILASDDALALAKAIEQAACAAEEAKIRDAAGGVS